MGIVEIANEAWPFALGGTIGVAASVVLQGVWEYKLQKDGVFIHPWPVERRIMDRFGFDYHTETYNSNLGESFPSSRWPNNNPKNFLGDILTGLDYYRRAKE